MVGRRELVAEGPSERLDQYLALRCPGLSRSQVKRLIEKGQVTVNGRVARPSLRLLGGEHISVVVHPPEASALAPEPIPLQILYEDKDLLVVDKPPGLPVHPGPGHPGHTLVNALLAHCHDLSGIGGVVRPGIVHRLDKETSGLLTVAKNDAAHASLARQLKERTVRKGYLALVWGVPHPDEGVVDAPLGRDPRNRKRMAVVPEGRSARTRYKLLRSYTSCSLLEVFPETGRTHQIRVHLASLGHPVVGDPLYSPRKTELVQRQFLHAYLLGFRLPSTGKYVEFTCKLPPDLESALQRLERMGRRANEPSPG